MTKIASIALSIAMVMSQIAALSAAEKANDANVTDPRAAALEAEISMRIVGGERADSSAWPWQVVLYIRGKSGNFSMSCGGSLIHPGWGLSAPHCLDSQTPPASSLLP